MSERFTLSPFEFFARATRTRFPFRYGIASLTEVPHQVLRVRVQVGHASSFGLASEGLAPKWFTKNPATPVSQDLQEMRAVIHHAAEVATALARQPVTFFEFWRELSRAQAPWAAMRAFPPLLANLGVSLCERAVLDGLCRALAQPLHQLIRDNRLGLRLGEVYPELGRAEPRDLLPATPRDHVHARHTIGLTDPLTPAEIPDSERVDDGLPQDLESGVRAYGLRYFKVKLCGDAERDRVRLRAFHSVVNRATSGEWFTTLDGNESFQSVAALREFWASLCRDPALHGLRQRVLVVEQPVHRDHALSDEAGASLQNWPDRPPLIIDESDGALGDVARALALGYAGTSHKNCKGIVKGLANACLLERRRRQGSPVALTGEDLCILGPLALLQDLAMLALLGVEHVERNGHHYYRGLSMWPENWQQAVLTAHGDLYTRHPAGFARLDIKEGRIALGSVNATPFGLRPLLDPAGLV